MPSSLPPRRDTPGLRLKVQSTDESSDADDSAESLSLPALPWYAQALLAGAGGAIGSWLIVAGVVVVGWLFARTGELSDALGVATQVWLLANGGGLVVDGHRMTLIPLGLTALLALLPVLLTHVVTRQALVEDEDDGLVPAPGRTVRNIVLLSGGAYAATVTLGAALGGAADQGGRALVGALVVGALAAYAGASRAAGHTVADALPAWAAPVPPALTAGLSALVAGGAAALASALLLHRGQVADLYRAMAPEPASAVALTVAQLAYLPNLILWAVAYALGAGFSLGDGALVSPMDTDLGLLPGVPVLAALPVEGAGSYAALAWLAVGVVAGTAAAVVVARARPDARFDETALGGGLAGVLVALVVTAFAYAASGGLGDQRLKGLGPRLPELVTLGGAVIGMSGVVAGLVVGLLRPGRARRRAESVVADVPAADAVDEDEPTAPIH